MINDTKLYPIIAKDGKLIGYFKAADFYFLNKTIQMPSIVFQIGQKTSTGYLRNSKIFWKQYSKKYIGDLSENNLKLIEAGKSPIVDKQWIVAYPNHKGFIGDTLEHHHLHHGGKAVPLPVTLHRLEGNKKVFHTM
jgi:hypothetical protein